MQGLTYLDGVELECTIMDLSTTGARLEIKPCSVFSNPAPFAQTIANDSIIDIRIPEMHMDGEVKVIRKEIKKDLLYLSVVFTQVFFGLENVPYKRKVYRKKWSSFGHITVAGQNYEAVTQNVSVKGMLLVIYGAIDYQEEHPVEISFNHLNIHGSARVIWSKITKKNHTWLGLEYINLDASVKGIATFPIEANKLD